MAESHDLSRLTTSQFEIHPPGSTARRAAAWRELRAYLLAFLAAFILFGSLTAALIQHEYVSTLATWKERQSSMADDRLEMLDEWLRERRGDAETLSTRSSVIEPLSAGRAASGAQRKAKQASLSATLDAYTKNYEYDGLYALDGSGKVAARTSGAEDLTEGERETLAAVRAEKVSLRVLNRPQTALLSISAPVYAEARPGQKAHPRLLGVVVLLSDLHRRLFPYFSRETVPTRTGETILLRRMGSELEFLVPLRNLAGHPALFRRPFTEELAAASALAGRKTFGEFTDYRGAKVLAATRRVEFTGWGLVSKVDRTEALGGFYRLAFVEAAAAGLLLAVFGILLWAYRRQSVLRIQERAERELRRLNRALRTLSECNQAMVRARDEADLLQSVCRLLVEEGGYAMAWVGYTQMDEAKSVKPVAWAGMEEGYLQTARITWAEEERGQGPTGRAIRSGRSVVAQDFLTDPDFAPWRAEALRHGYASSVSLPLVQDGRAFGALMLYSRVSKGFDEEEVRLLEELAHDFAYGIQAQRTRTGLERAEDEVRRANAYNRSLLEVSLDPLVTISPEGKITDVNTATEKVTGRSRRELVGTDFSRYFVDPAKASAGYQRVFREGAVKDYPLEILHADGRTTPVLYNATVYRDDRGEVVGVFAAARDVSERRQAEIALQRANAYNRSLIEASLDPLVTISPEGKITDVNTATEKVTGRARGELIGTDFSEYFTDPGRARAGYQQVFREGTVQDYDLEIRHPDGHSTPVLYNASVYRDDQGGVIGVFAAARDITERKRAQEAVEKERRRFNSILERLPVYVVLLAPDYRVPFANRYFRERFGESEGQRCYEYLFNRTEPCEVCESFKVLKTPARHEWEWKGPDGRDYQIYDFPFADTDGSPLVLEMGMDVTERKRAEAEIRQLNDGLEQRVRERTAELEAANKEMEAFTYSVSHDLRAPLRHVDGFSKLLLEEYAAQLPEDARHYLDRIRNGTRQMGQLVDDLLNLSRVGRSELSLQITGLGSLVGETVNELVAENPARQVEWKIAPLPFVECDPALMKQVFTNLLSNAMKFTRPRAPAKIEVGMGRHQNRDVVFVRDNGVGFSMKFADKLFGVFQRLHRAEDFEGTGVGLATVQRIIHKHHGEVWAEAELDRGATFYFTLGEAAPDGKAGKAA